MTTITINTLAIDTGRWHVTLDGAPVKLAKREFELLAKLASDPERVWRYDELLADVWGYQSTSGVGNNALKACVFKLRRALGGRFIETVHSVGYKLGSGRPARVAA